MDREKSCGSGNRRVLLHVCCAPDAAVPLRDLRSEGWDPVGYFYGSNIHPEDEYRRRAAAVAFLAERERAEIRVRPYDPEEWLALASPLAGEPERGARCALCFELQLRAAAEEGRKIGASRLGSTLSISPHKDVVLLSRLGFEIASAYGLEWDCRVWRKKNGFLRSLKAGEELRLYRQTYCGCLYSRGSPPPATA
jgi:predicted adenine nucleotide alpha hydrolase (AANH) superfamily ATPase